MAPGRREPGAGGPEAARPRGGALLHRSRAARARGTLISPALLERLVCPVCLEPGGCLECRPGASGHEACRTLYRRRVACACGGPEKVRLETTEGALSCPCCGERYPVRPEAGYVDLVPRTATGEVTQYADQEFHDRLRVTEAPPLLSARVKADMMLRGLRPEPGDPVLDLGCGAGKFALYTGTRGARPTGLDVAPFFLDRAVREVDLVLGDVRRLPFAKGSFPRAYTLDVLEHLDEEGVLEVLVEARRTVGPAGRLFVYTHAMESSRLALFQRGTNALAGRLGRAGLLDHEREALRKSDHKNPIRSHEHFDELCARAGLEVEERRYYNVVAKAVVEDLLLRLWEHRSTRPRRKTPGAAPSPAVPGARVGAPAPGRAVQAVAVVASFFLKLDVVLFGGIRTGPFFGILKPRRP